MIFNQPPASEQNNPNNCPFLEDQYYIKLNKLGFEYDPKTNGLHFLILTDNYEGIAFDAYEILGDKNNVELHFSEFSFSNKESVENLFKNKNYQSSIIAKSNLENVIKPFLARAHEWRSPEEINFVDDNFEDNEILGETAIC